MFGKKNQAMQCFACGGHTTRDAIHEHYLFCLEMNALRGLNKGLGNQTKTINQQRAEAGLTSVHYSGSAIDEPIVNGNIEWLKSATERLDRERKAKSWKPPLNSDLLMRCVTCHHPDPEHSSKCSQPGLLYNAGTNREHQYSTEEVRQTSSTGGQKGTKPEEFAFIPIEPQRALARIYGKGAVKYDETPDKPNWRKGYPLSQSYNAAMRHLTAFWNGEDLDPEMQESHLMAVVFHMNTMFVCLKEHPEFDDRYVPPTEKVESKDLSNVEALETFTKWYDTFLGPYNSSSERDSAIQNYADSLAMRMPVKDKPKQTTDDLISNPFDTKAQFEKWWEQHLKTNLDLYKKDLDQEIYNRNLAWLAHNDG